MLCCAVLHCTVPHSSQYPKETNNTIQRDRAGGIEYSFQPPEALDKIEHASATSVHRSSYKSNQLHSVEVLMMMIAKIVLILIIIIIIIIMIAMMRLI